LLDDVARRGVRTVLTGFGGDLLMQPVGHEVAHHLREGRLRAALGATTLGRDPLSSDAWSQLARQSVWAFAPRLAQRLREARRPSQPPRPWLSRSAAEVTRAHVADEEAMERRAEPDAHLAALRHLVTRDTGTLLPMVLQDRAGASRAFDYRHPLYDLRVVELLLTLPLEQRFTRAQTKGVLRRAMGPALPSLVRERRDKAEFGSYVRVAFLEGQRDALRRLFRASCLEALGLVEGDALRKLLDSAPEAQSALTELTAMELWLQASPPSIVHTSAASHHEDQHEHG
jgi:asparagine synthetase B (glutamine-hydrolysing)